MIKLKPIDYQIISELIKNPRLSDRQLGKILKSSQPTITRRRREIDKEGLLDYTAIPNLKKLGFQILAFTFANSVHEEHPATHVEETKKFIKEHPNIIFISTGSVSSWDRIIISVHKDYDDYSKLVEDHRTGWGKYFKDLSSFLVSFENNNILSNTTFKYFSELVKKSA